MDSCKELSQLKTLFLSPVGWCASKKLKAPVDIDSKPLPWFTYGAIEFLGMIVRPSDRVFEYGAGYSTLWWQDNVSEVHSVEHDPLWAKKLADKLKSNVTLSVKEIDSESSLNDGEAVKPFFSYYRNTTWDYDKDKIVRRGLEDYRFVSYSTHILKAIPPPEKFDFIVVDGMARRLCVWLSINQLALDGFIVLDNSNRSDYDLAYKYLFDAGFVQLPFWGLVPGSDFHTCTSFFTRSINRLPKASFSKSLFGLPEY